MRTIASFIILTAVSGYGHAEEVTIKGAFGIELGQLIPADSPMIQRERTSSDGSIFLIVIPPSPISILKLNFVRVLAKSRRVFAIGGMSETCRNRWDLRMALTAKYGGGLKQHSPIPPHNNWYWSMQSRSISLECAREDLSLSYRDRVLEKQIEVEIISPIDTDNL